VERKHRPKALGPVATRVIPRLMPPGLCEALCEAT